MVRRRRVLSGFSSSSLVINRPAPRPRSPEAVGQEKKRVAVVTLRLLHAEREAVEQAAERAGIRLSAWMQTALLEKAENAQP